MNVLRRLIVTYCSCFAFLLTASTQPKYEFRGVWIATVNNIDWPSRKGLPANMQQAEYVDMLDRLQQMGMNAVVVQVRPSADAFYPSQYEPWSEFLNGAQGLPPVPYYDPLQFMISEAHKRNMEFHAWLNPYRAVFDVNGSSIAPTHITRLHKEWFVTYGNKKYFNPGLPETRQFVTRIVRDIVSRYDVDAIHMDDYFYPYRIAGKEFPDAAAYNKYGRGLSKDAWRRSNCDSIILMIREAILSVKPMVRFGISPFGVWRNSSQDPEGSNTRAGQTNYDDLYADILLWLRNGWIDYVTPQLYWERNHPLCDYETLLQWWSEHSYGKHVYIGHGIYRAWENPTAAWRNPKELPAQLQSLRNTPDVQGSIYFSAKSILRNPNGWADSLGNAYYARPALVPPMPWVDTGSPLPPTILNCVEGGKTGSPIFTLNGRAGYISETQDVKQYVLYVSADAASLGSQPVKIVPAGNTKEFSIDFLVAQLPAQISTCYVACTSVDKENNESALSNTIRLEKTTTGWAVRQ